MQLKDTVVIITGGTAGIGYALAKAFKNEGAHVVICADVAEHVKNVSGELGVTGIVADVTKESDIENLVAKVTEQFGRIDIWINNAGIFHMFDPNEPFDNEKAHKIFEVNVFGTIHGSRIALKQMKQAGSGMIVNILSSIALDASRGKNTKIYAASKWAARGFTEALRGENKDTAIKILAVYPGGTKTNLYDEKLPDTFDSYMEPDYVAEKVIENIKLEIPEQDLVIKRPTVQ